MIETTTNAIANIVSYIIGCWLIYSILVTGIKYRLFMTGKLSLEAKNNLDSLHYHWFLAPFLLPFIICVIFKSTIKNIFKEK